MSSHEIITIDGPAGAGKTTVSRELALRLGFMYVDTGALYRAIAYEISCSGTDWEDEVVLDSFLTSVKLDVAMADGKFAVRSAGKDISDLIRTPEISLLASAVSAAPAVRKYLLKIQRGLARGNDTVFEGRDMGTVVFPKADFKFFLHADLATRAGRRFIETSSPLQSIEDVKKDIAKRDKNDTQRKEAPLRPAADAVLIDSTHLSVEQVVDTILKHMGKFSD